ncbi:arginine deiminase-related protein [Silanimonas lenta]|uniref:arginine deiminase-related protein n=1 Tax=Silanimonas lenta TaxID=265429 RepID=UPI0003F791AA|nr:arginine deiminase-related protein [Silanimonas lenta]
MITRDPEAFFAFAATRPPEPARALPKAVFLVAPEGLRLAEESAQDNRYMALGQGIDAERALAEHRALARALSAHVPVITFPGDPATPDAVFPNNVFATAPGRLVVGHMRHAVRRREAGRADIRAFFARAAGYACLDLSRQPGICELTGSLVIDRARNVGYCGLSERCDEAGAAAMHDAFGLDATLVFELAAGEYHTNVLLQVYAGRLAVACPDGFADPALARAILRFYAPHALALGTEARLAYAGNGIAVSADAAFLSARAEAALGPAEREAFARAGFTLHAVPLPEIEKAGGSLRCCVGEWF